MQYLVSLYVVAYSVALSLFTETVQYLLIYRTSAFRTLKANLEKHKKKLDEAKSATGGSKGLKKKQTRLETWQQEAAKQTASIQWWTMITMMVSLFLGFKLLTRLFAGQVVGKLPFSPPGFIRKIAHQGLDDSVVEPDDCSAFFIYALCQSSVRPMISKLLGWGPTRAMLEVKPWVPKPLQNSEWFKQS